MKKFFEKMMADDESQQKFTKKEIVVYGIMVPVAFFTIMCLAGWLETCSENVAIQ